MNLINLNYFVFLPLGTIIILYIINIYLYFVKSREVVSSENKVNKSKIITIFILLLALLYTPALYWLIVFLQIIWSKTVNIWSYNIYIFLWGQFSTIILQFIAVRIWLLKLAERNNFSRTLTFIILWIAITEIPSILALIYIFKIIGNA